LPRTDPTKPLNLDETTVRLSCMV